MKLLLTALSTGVIVCACHTNCMDKARNPRHTTPLVPPYAILASKGAKTAARAEQTTAAPISNQRGRSVPELAKLVNEVLSLKESERKHYNALFEQMKIVINADQQREEEHKKTSLQLSELIKVVTLQSEMILSQGAQIQAQGTQIATLLAITRATCGSFLSAETLSRLEAEEPLNPEFAEFAATTQRTWKSNLSGTTAEKLWESPNHPRISLGASGTTHNPWESPNHERK